MVGLWALLKPIMTAPFIASLSLWNSLASDAQFKKGEAIYIYIYFFFFFFSLIEKKNSCRGRFSKGELRTTNSTEVSEAVAKALSGCGGAF